MITTVVARALLPVMPTNELVLCYLVMLLMLITPCALALAGAVDHTVVAPFGGKGFPSEIKEAYAVYREKKEVIVPE